MFGKISMAGVYHITLLKMFGKISMAGVYHTPQDQKLISIAISAVSAVNDS